jgi:isoleucyl-tRNA synthetase
MIDSLSNWYVRLNRKRFWKAEMNTDKLAAYQTLRESLLAISKLIAPVSPFHAERLYLDLTARAPELESVHTTDFPAPEEGLVDDALNAQMDAVRRAASLALSVRKDKGIKVRQPLARLTIIADEQLRAALQPLTHVLSDEVNVKHVELAGTTSDAIQRSAQLNFREAGPRFGKQTKHVAERIKQLGVSELVQLDQGKSVTIEVDGQAFDLSPELVKINVRGKAGAEVATDGSLTVVLDTTLTDGLRLEGFARELVSAIQRLRKGANFEVTTRINLTGVRHPALESALREHEAYIRAETLCESVTLVEELNVEPVTVEEIELRLQVSEPL